jgi:hypothetical protein
MPALVLLFFVTSGAVGTGVTAWVLGHRWRFGWILHLMLVPALVAVQLLILAVYLRLTDDGGEINPGAGLILFPILGLLALVISVYYVALLAEMVDGFLDRRRK